MNLAFMGKSTIERTHSAEVGKLRFVDKAKDRQSFLFGLHGSCWIESVNNRCRSFRIAAIPTF